MLVDTPGVNDLSLQRADITYSYIPRADAVLFLLDAGQTSRRASASSPGEAAQGSRATRSSSWSRSGTSWTTTSRRRRSRTSRTQLAQAREGPGRLPVSAPRRRSQGGATAERHARARSRTSRRSSRRSAGASCSTTRSARASTSRALLRKGVDARRRALAMKTEELERRIELLEEDLAGQARTIEQRRINIREEVSGDQGLGAPQISIASSTT